ncbi:MAG TPA: hypothetical protein VGO52_26660 [Hyphomonadaceae bacterium]|jgi:hypothetical protein|nr:hypothetical protein [Hyphomonadaceae bacterium]
MADETKKPDEAQTTSSALSDATKTPLHDAIFGNDPDGQDNDTPRGAIGQNVVLLTPAAQPEGFGPMTAVGDNDRRH